MKTPIMMMACSVAVSSLLAQNQITPLNVQTGLWQGTTTWQISGNAAQSRTDTNKGCLRQEDLTRDPFATKNNDTMKCTENLLRSNSSDAEVDMSCKDDQGNSGEFHVTYHAVDREHVTGTGQGSANMFGQTMKSNWTFQAQWIAASCPVETK